MTTSGPLLDDWIESLTSEEGLQENSCRSYRSDASDLCAWLEEKGAGLDTCDRDLLDGYLVQRGQEGLEASSLARRLSSLRSLFGFLIREKQILRDPTDLLQTPRTTRWLPDTLSIAEVLSILEGIGTETPVGLRDRALIELLYGAGLRVSEALSLRVDQIRNDEGWVLVEGKGARQRLVPVGREALGWIERYRREVRPSLAPKSDHLFLNLRGGPLSRVSAWRLIQTHTLHLSQQVGPHTFRHSYATHLLEGGIDLRILQELLGHADISTTQIYTHLDREYLREAHRTFHPRERDYHA